MIKMYFIKNGFHAFCQEHENKNTKQNGILQTVPGSHLFTFVKNGYQIEFNALRFHIFFSLNFAEFQSTFLTKRQTSIIWWRKANNITKFRTEKSKQMRT